MYEVRVVARTEDKEVKAMHLVDNALTCAECEMKVWECYNGDCDAISIVRSKIREIVNEKASDDEQYYKATIVQDVPTDNGKSKENKYYVLVAAKDIPDANDKMLCYLEQGMRDFRLDAIVKTKIKSVLEL